MRYDVEVTKKLPAVKGVGRDQKGLVENRTNGLPVSKIRETDGNWIWPQPQRRSSNVRLWNRENRENQQSYERISQVVWMRKKAANKEVDREIHGDAW